MKFVQPRHGDGKFKPVPLAVRFWRSVAINNPDECWPWKASLGKDGYGQFGGAAASRWAYRLTFGEPPEDTPLICHTCHNRRCCNPRHLYAGTPMSNAKDRDQAGRTKRLFGEHNEYAKLSNADVQDIKQRLARGESNKSIAADYPVDVSNISHIKRGFSRRYA